jgi:hypothetical protein
MVDFDHGGKRRRKRERQARRAEQRLRRQQRADQRRQARQSPRPQRPPDPAPLRNFLLARLAEADRLYGLKTATLAHGKEACDRVEARGGEYLALVMTRAQGGHAVLVTSTVPPCPEPDACPVDHEVTPARLTTLAEVACRYGRLCARASPRWLALLDQALGEPPGGGPAWLYTGPEEPT